MKYSYNVMITEWMNKSANVEPRFRESASGTAPKPSLQEINTKKLAKSYVFEYLASLL